MKFINLIGLLTISFGTISGQQSNLLPNATDCSLEPADIVFVLDSSGSVTETNFKKELAFVEAFVRKFKIGPKHVQVGVITYSTMVQNRINLNQYSDNASLVDAIGKIPYLPGSTHTGDAMQYALNVSFTTAHGDRDSVANVMIVLTDGISNRPQQVIGVASQIHAAGIETIAVGVGGSISTKELKHIASDDQHVFHVSNFEALKTLEAELRNSTCNALSQNNSVCKNKIADCARYGKEACIQFPIWAREFCAFSCRFCSASANVTSSTPQNITASMTTPTHSQTTVLTTTIVMTPPPLPIIAGECKDKFGNCVGYGISVCDKYRSWSVQNCARFCGFCHAQSSTPPTPPPLSPVTTTAVSQCLDVLDNCNDYGIDSCLLYKTWATNNCAKTCGICGSPTVRHPTTRPHPTTPPTTTVTTSTTTTTTTPTTTVTTTPTFVGECKDRLSSCPNYGPEICVKYKSWAMQQCPQYCVFCTPPTTPPPPTTEPPCVDRGPDCTYLGPIICFQNRTWAENNCRAFCLFCTPPDSASPLPGQSSTSNYDENRNPNTPMPPQTHTPLPPTTSVPPETTTLPGPISFTQKTTKIEEKKLPPQILG